MHLTQLSEVHLIGLDGDVTVQTGPPGTGVDWQTTARLVAEVRSSLLELKPSRGADTATGTVALIVAQGTCLRFTRCQGNQSGPGGRNNHLTGAAQTLQV